MSDYKNSEAYKNWPSTDEYIAKAPAAARGRGFTQEETDVALTRMLMATAAFAKKMELEEKKKQAFLDATADAMTLEAGDVKHIEPVSFGKLWQKRMT